MTDTQRASAKDGPSWATPSTLPLARQAERAGVIEQSHLRCAALGLNRIERPDFDTGIRSDLSVARDRNHRLFRHAAPVMEMLFEQIIGTESMIVLADAYGTILHSVGDDRFMARAGKVALSPGVNWAEQSMGTNAIGTALVAETATVVRGGEHFIHANNFLTCSATPLFDPCGNVLGVLDVSGDQRSHHEHTMGLVRMSARMIENQWLADDYDYLLRLHFHSRTEFIGTVLEGIIVVGTDGKIVGANRSALDQLNMSSAALRMHSLISLFGTTEAAAFDHFRATMPSPMCLSLSDGRKFFVNARFNSLPRSLAAGFDLEDVGGRLNVSKNPTTTRANRSQQSNPADHAKESNFSGLHYLMTGDPQIESIVQKVKRVLNRDIPLLILGETGTGKELLARAIHQDSNRSGRSFVAVNCASIPEALIEAELFGYEDGAFTGARRKGAPGRIFQANQGTLFLDEIGDMPLALQARLLRVLQERCVTPLGSQKSIAIDISVIGATHRNLRDMIEAGTFREDLYYRLNGVIVRLPALRERSDLDVVARRILFAECPDGTPAISPSVMALFRRYSWPGNVRQLSNVLRMAAVMASGESRILEDHLSDDFLEDVQRLSASSVLGSQRGAPQAFNAAYGVPDAANDIPVSFYHKSKTEKESLANGSARTLEEVEVEVIREALAAAGGNISVASKRLGISRNTIYRKLRWSKDDS